MNKLLLKERVTAILDSDDFKGIHEWYKEIIMSYHDYVVFTVRRSYLLALIMEKVTELNMEENNKAIFLTDSSIILFCDKFAEQYKKTGTFPTVLLCDDTLIHGRNINHFLENMEDTLCALLPDYKKDNIRDALVRSVQVHVYAKLNMQSLILSRYELNIKYKHKGDNAYIHKLSNDISSLIMGIDMANACYIYSEHLSEIDFSKLDLKNFIETSYQNTKQFTRVQYVGQDKEKKAIITLRIVKNNGCEGYRVIPFIFMPNLGEEETDFILDSMTRRMENAKINRNFIQLLYYLKDIRGKRTFNELVTLWLSQVILQDFYIENNMYNFKPDENEICKLARNFNCGNILGFRSLESYKEMINTIVLKQVFTINDIVQIVNDSILDKRKLLCVTADNDYNITEKDKQQIKENLEDYFYNTASQYEENAYMISQKPYYLTSKRSEINVRGCGFILREINNGYTELQAAYSMAYFLQMMDAGVLTLSSCASKKIRVVGFSQFAKPGEQSLLLMPLRMYEWIPLIYKIQWYCKWHGREFENEIYEYGSSKECDINVKCIEKIVKFVKKLSSMGQEAAEWTGNYINKKELPILEGIPERIVRFDFMETQLAHVKQYTNYRGI